MYVPDLTQALGTVAFLGAVVANLRTRRACLRLAPGAAPIWSGLAIFYFALAIEVNVGARYTFTRNAVAVLANWIPYEQRAMLQVPALVLLIVLVGVCLFMMFGAAKLPPACRAALAVAGVCLALFCAEAISLHRLDQALYLSLGKVLLVGWCWLVLCALAVFAAQAYHSLLSA